MTKEDFNNLDIIEQSNYINEKLVEGNTLTNICKSIGLGRSTIRDRFEKAGYKYNSEIKQYQSYVEIVEHESSNDVVRTESENKQILETQSSNFINNLVVGTDNQYNYEDLIKVIENYNDLNNKMDQVYSWYVSQNSNDVVEANKFAIKEFKGDTVARSFKLYDSVQKEFMKFCKKNNKYKVQDILSTLLFEAMEKYK